MPTPDTFWTYSSAISVYLIVLAVPGTLIGWAAGLRGWSLAGLAPLLTYTATGLAGPWLALAGLPYNVGTAAAFTVLLAGAAYGVRALGLRRGWIPGEALADRPPLPWTKRAHLAVAACVVLATVLSIIVVLSASGGPNAVFQRWDTVFHANGIRYIADTGDGSLTGMGTINWYPNGSFYPNAYHLVGALVYNLSGATIPATLNAITVPVAGIFALSMVTMIRQFGGRAVFAGSVAIVAGAATTGAYESVSSGLLPFALGIVLTPLAAVALQRYLVRPAVDTGMVLALAAVGLLCAHSSALFGAMLFAFPMVVQRWIRREGRVWQDILRMLPVMAASGVLAALQVLGAVGFTSSAYPYTPWASNIEVTEALNQLLKFRQILNQPQLWLAGLLVIGILSFMTLGRMRWIAASAVILSFMFVLVACYGGVSWVITLSRPWWNDRYRLMALAAIPLCLLAGHGLAEIQRWLSKAVSQWSWVRDNPRVPARLGLASAVLVLIAMGVVTQGFYTQANATAVAFLYHNGPESKDREQPISAYELEAMAVLQKLGVGPDERVLNDRVDGSAWVYAITGIKPTAGHYDTGVPPKDAEYLADHFRDFDTDPEVRAAVKRLNIHRVFLGHGSIKPYMHRAPGLRDLDGLDFLRREYANPNAVIYTIIK
ncbi:DUF6541 family protein [Amycolatopsis sp. NPDC059657]|uniref:DUF6541 family protein n=1 Tax=Amycolatopsis sp. NPDC059657 TaxID=3346899 RepID=UPI003673058A